MAVLLLIVSAISAGMLGVLNVYTAPIVARNKEVKFKSTVLDAFGIKYNLENIDEVFDKGVNTKKADGMVYYEYSKGGNLAAIAFEVMGAGFWAPISAIIALEPDLETVKDLKIIDHTETPGLGARIVEPGFQSQFRGKKIIPHLSIVPYRKAVGANEVDAITGATETSKALEHIINKNAKIYLEMLNKG